MGMCPCFRDKKTPDTFVPQTDTTSPRIGHAAIYRALYNYEPREENDLGFRQGDTLTILNGSIHQDWWEAEHRTTKRKGLIPRNFVVEANNQTESQDWWFTCDRRDANKQLVIPGNPRGTFLIRKSKHEDKYALSIRDFGDVSENVDIKHYHIRVDDHGRVYVNRHRSFASLKDLVDHYRKTPDGLCCRLTNSCPKEPEMIPFKNLEVIRSDITMLSKLGSGKFGEVWKGRYKGKMYVAVKNLIPGKMSQEDFLKEARTLHCMRHRRLVQLMGICTIGTPMYIVMEFLENGALIDYIKKDNGQRIFFKHILDMAAQVSVADGMSYLEIKNYIHRDLRAANILVDRNKSVKVADFGLARILDEDNIYLARDDSQFPVKWTAPEAANFKRFTIKSDVWSYGVLLYELVTYGDSPYKGIRPHDIIDRLETGYRLPNPAKNNPNKNIVCPKELYNKMLECWHDDPDRRPTFASLASYFDDYYTETEAPYQEET